jgi:hypothetical protein
MNAGRNAFAAAIDAMPGSRSSLTRRSCSVPKARSPRPVACEELAQMMSILSACSARPNWVMPSPHHMALGLAQIIKRRLRGARKPRYGRPIAFYSDKFSVFRVNRKDAAGAFWQGAGAGCRRSSSARLRLRSRRCLCLEGGAHGHQESHAPVRQGSPARTERNDEAACPQAGHGHRLS